MNFIDIILIICLVYAAWSGFRDGIATQLAGLIALFAGVYLAFRLCDTVSEWIGMGGTVAGSVIGFVIVLLAVIVIVVLLGKVLRGLFRITRLGMLDEIGGLVLGVVKMALILSVLIIGFESINRSRNLIAQKRLDHSLLYYPLWKLAPMCFPYLDPVVKAVTPDEKKK